MKVSRNWLQTYFNQPLPKVEELADALTFHAFEIEEIASDTLDVKVLPNRAADCLCHRGIAKELSAILNIPLKNDPLREALKGSTLFPNSKVEPCNALTVTIEDPKKCLRYMGALVKGIKIGPSPTWLKEALESVGQRSINNVVDATNYIMLNIGQPLHAFDAMKLVQKDGIYSIGVRGAKDGEKITTLSGEEYILNPNVLLITDANADSVIGIAGVKGGNVAEVTSATTDIIIESANFDGTTIRRAAQALKLSTDASLRFQNRPSPELVAYGIRDVLALIKEVAGGEVAGIIDEYPVPPEQSQKVSVSLARINSLLGSSFSTNEVSDVFKRLDLNASLENDTFAVAPSFDRTDLTIPEDLIEEVGRIIGYDHVPATELSPIDGAPDQARFRGIERMKDQLVEQGFTEVSTQSFASKGDIYLANPLDKNRPSLRTNLENNLKDALTRAKQYAPLVLAPNQQPKLFEIGTVFPKTGEQLAIATSESATHLPEIKDDPEYIPKSYTLSAYKPFSVFPFIVRDIALWMPADADEKFTKSLIREHAGELLARLDQFDCFLKEGRVSLAFRLVFQSMERTLTDDEVNGAMTNITTALTAHGYNVR